MKINPNLVWRKIEDNIFIIDPQNNILYELNETGSFIFQEIVNDSNRLEILINICAKYDVSFDEAKKDLDDLIEKMIEWGILYEE